MNLPVCIFTKSVSWESVPPNRCHTTVAEVTWRAMIKLSVAVQVGWCMQALFNQLILGNSHRKLDLTAFASRLGSYSSPAAHRNQRSTWTSKALAPKVYMTELWLVMKQDTLSSLQGQRRVQWSKLFWTQTLTFCSVSKGSAGFKTILLKQEEEAYIQNGCVSWCRKWTLTPPSLVRSDRLCCVTAPFPLSHASSLGDKTVIVIESCSVQRT